ncbi:MAG: efflux RND transporter periplasmic adaptor subunit [Acidobacteria bacterium]|nr:efflux RND transporter periplasmic adaptor subunit [Acidobacteriota bacterium]
MKPWKKKLMIAGGALLAAILLAGGIYWSRRGVVTVQTGKVVKQDLASVVTASGQIRPLTTNFASVNANTFGKITDIYVKEGDQVKKGQLLLRTESVQQEADVEAQQAALTTARADVSATDAAVQSASANLKTAQADLQTAQANFARARDDFARAEGLLKDKLIAQQLYDQRRAEFAVAQANIQAAESRIVQSRALLQQSTFNRDMSRARVAQNRAGLTRAQDLRSKTLYTSPLDGIITNLPVNVGENVVPGIQNTVGSMLFQISNLSVITAEIKVDETDIINLRLGQLAEVTIDAIRDKTFKGTVTEIGQSAIGRTTGQTTMGQTTSGSAAEEAKDFKVVVTLDNPPPGLRPGLSTTAKVTTATRQNTPTVPIQALAIRMRRDLEEDNKEGKGAVQAASVVAPTGGKSKDKGKEEIQGVFVVRNGRAVFTQVETGIMGATDIEILKGVNPGEEIVTGTFSVLRSLKNNAKVKIDNKPQKPVAPSST